MADGALKPSFNVNLASDDKAKQSEVTDEEKHLYNVSITAGWRILDEFMQRQIDLLDSINADAVSKGLSFEDIGKNTLVLIQVKDIVNRIRNKVNDAKETVEKPNGTIES